MVFDINLKKAILSLKRALQVAWLSLWSELALDLPIYLASVRCRTWQKKILSFCFSCFSCLTSICCSMRTSLTACLYHLSNTSWFNSAYYCKHRLQNLYIFGTLFRGLIFMLRGKMAMSHLGAFIKSFRSSISSSWVWHWSPQGKQKYNDWTKFL